MFVVVGLKIMESPVSLSRMHWDHEQRELERRPPARRDGNATRLATDRRSALRFMDPVHDNPLSFAPASIALMVSSALPSRRLLT
jgi:hypothetical protein